MAEALASKQQPVMDAEEVAGREVNRLQRQFRDMLQDRVACPEAIRSTITSQKKIIKMLTEEKSALTEKLAYSQSRALEKDKYQNSKDILACLKDYKSFSLRINKKRQNLKDLHVQIVNTKQKIDELVKVAPCEVALRSKEHAHIDNLKLRLHAETVRVNTKIVDNETLQGEILDLLQERDIFSRRFDALENELGSAKKIIYDLIEQGNHAYDSRNEAHKKLVKLKAKAKRGLDNNCIEAQKLAIKVDHFALLNDFLARKGQERTIDADESITSLGSEGQENEQEVRKSPEENLAEYLNIISQVQETFECDQKQIVPKVIKLRKDNYNYYSFINELNKKLDSMRDEVCSLQSAIERQETSNMSSTEEFSQIIGELLQEVEESSLAVLTVEGDLKKLKDQARVLLLGIQEIFNIVGGNAEPISRMLGDNTIISSDNYVLYLKALEKRLQDLNFFASCRLDFATPRKSGPERPMTMMTEAPKDVATILPSQPCPLCAEIKDISEVDESVVKPLEVDSVRKSFRKELQEGDRKELLHSVAQCRLPKSRRIIQMAKAANN